MPYNRLSTTKIARAVGCHPNTVRLYEQIGFISTAPRSAKGYRLYTPLHLDQMRLARLAMQGEWPGPNIRHSLIALVRKMAEPDLLGALALAKTHLEVVRNERAQADAAVDFLNQWVFGGGLCEDCEALQIGQAAQLLNVTVDVLRNWERNGLVTTPRDPHNRYRRYYPAQIGRLRVIRFLRQVGYSPMAILRMLLQLDQKVGGDIQSVDDLRRALDTPRPDEDVYTAADHWLSTLTEQEQRAQEILNQMTDMAARYA
jgi:DNA-binding transcriptional MerR regulator